jgi:hypothetical protein
VEQESVQKLTRYKLELRLILAVSFVSAAAFSGGVLLRKVLCAFVPLPVSSNRVLYQPAQEVVVRSQV